jgi:hypothetical protein
MMLRHPDGFSLTDKESEITDLYLQLVIEEDMDPVVAALHALTALPNPDPQFAAWLAQSRDPRSG